MPGFREPLPKHTIKAKLSRIGVNTRYPDNKFYKPNAGLTKQSWEIEVVSNDQTRELGTKFWKTTSEWVLQGLLEPGWEKGNVTVKGECDGAMLEWTVTKNDKGYVSVKDVKTPPAPLLKSVPQGDMNDDLPLDSAAPEAYVDVPGVTKGFAPGTGLADEVKANIAANRAGKKGNGEGGPNLTGRDVVFDAALARLISNIEGDLAELKAYYGVWKGG